MKLLTIIGCFIWLMAAGPAWGQPGAAYELIAHRGGIVEGKYEEYDPASIEEAIRRGYTMLEVDVNSTRDGRLVMNHDQHFTRFFGHAGRVNEMTWAEISRLRAAKGRFHPPLFEDIARQCAGRIRLMIDVKAPHPSRAFYDTLLAIMTKYDLLNSAYFINTVSGQYTGDKGKLLFRVADLPAFKKRLTKDPDIRTRFFLFDNGLRLTREAVAWAQQNGIEVVPSINIEHYKNEDHRTGAKRDIAALQAMGVRSFQIDSDYGDWFPGALRAQLPPAGLPELRFRADHTFRIVQLSDLHYQYHSPRSDTALMRALAIIRREKPDLVVLTGDIVCSRNTFLAWRSLAGSLASAAVPWATTLGNHDVEYELTGKEIMDCIEGLPYNLTVNGPDSVPGHGNGYLPVLSSQGSATAAVAWLIDSHTSFRKNKIYGEYDWVKAGQINWYREESLRLREANNRQPLPSVMFMHIPLPEYNDLLYQPTTAGIQEELVCSPEMNSGLFTAMVESKDMMGLFCGHDHNNNFIGVTRNISLAYGAVSGLECYGKIGRGARVIILEEGKRRFTSWITNTDGQEKFRVTYPDSFIRK